MAPQTHDGPPVDSRDDGVPRRPPGPSTRPAMIVMGIALVVLLAGGIGAALTSSGSTVPRGPSVLKTAPGAGIGAIPGRPALRGIVSGGQPPDDILDAVAVPRGTRPKAGSVTNNGIGLYDHSETFTVGAPEERVITFFGAELRAFKWQIVSEGAAPHSDPGYRIVGLHPSSDGYEWEIGVTVEPTTFGAPPAGAGQTTPYTVRLFAVTAN